MNYTDLLLLLVLILCVWTSVRQGFINAALALISWVGSLAIALFYYMPFSNLLLKVLPSIGIWSAPIAFVVMLMVAKLVLDALSIKIIQRVPYDAQHSLINRILGILPGLANGFVWAALLAAFLLLMPVNNRLSQSARDSKLAESLVSKVKWLDDRLSPVFSEALNHSLPKNSAEVSSEKPIDLPFNVKSPVVRHDLEAEMLVLVNKERTKRGLKALKADPDIAVVAREHSVDMFARGYFSHYTPEGVDPFGRMKKHNIVFLTAGENLALAQTLAIAHTGLMNSPGHRANILNPAFGRLGIGILDGGIYGLMITQNFRN